MRLGDGSSAAVRLGAVEALHREPRHRGSAGTGAAEGVRLSSGVALSEREFAVAL